MAIELRVAAQAPTVNNVRGVPEITVYRYQFGLHWLSGDAVRFDDIRIRTFMYHHYGLTNSESSAYGPSELTPIVLNRGVASSVDVSWQWDKWQTDVMPPRIDDTLNPIIIPGITDRYYKFSQEITLYPGVGTNELLDSSNPNATGGNVEYSGRVGDEISTTTKFGRFSDVENSHSYLTVAAGLILNPDNFILEERVNSLDIQSINQVGSTVTVTTTTSHGLLLGEGIRINDVTSNELMTYNGNYKITSVPSTTTFTYESRSYTTPTVGSGGVVEKWVVLSGIAPSEAIGVNYPSTPAVDVGDHTLFTNLIYAEKDTAISEVDGIPLESTQWGTSSSLPVQSYSAGGSTNIKKAVWRFPVSNVTQSNSYKAEANFYTIQANTGSITMDLFPMINSTWTETTLATGTWSYINPLINETTPIDSYLFDSNSNQTEEFTYTKFDIDSSIISDWVDGVTVPDVALVKRADFILGEYFYVSEDSVNAPVVELRPFIVISGDLSEVDDIPPTVSLTNTISNFPILNASGDGAGNITYEVSDGNLLSIGDIINVKGTGIYDGKNLEIIGASGINKTVEIVGNTETTVISAGYVNSTESVYVNVEAVDNEEIDSTPSSIAIDKTLLLNPITPENIVKNIPSTMVFDFSMIGIDDGYYQIQVSDVANNQSSLLTSPILMNYSLYTDVNNFIPNPKYVRLNDTILVRGFNSESFISSFRYVIGDISNGGLNLAPVPISIGVNNLLPTLNGFEMTVPNNQSKEFVVSSIDTNNNTISVSNAPNFYIGMSVTFANKGIIQAPLMVGKTYFIESVTYVSTTAVIRITDTLGGSSISLTPTVDVGDLYLYNQDTPLYVIRDGIDSSEYNNVLKINVDDFGPIITIPEITDTNVSIQIQATDPAGVDPSTAVVTFGNITSSTDVNGDGTSYLFDVDVGPTSGNLRFTVRDTLGNERFQESVIPIVDDIFIKVNNYDIISEESFVLSVQVISDTIPAVIANSAGEEGIFVSASNGFPYGSISNLISTTNGIEFVLTVSSIGDGIFTIWANDGIDTDTLTPIVITNIEPSCIQTNNILSIHGANLGDPSIESSTSVGGGQLVSQSNTLYQVLITGTIEGVSNLILSAVIDGDNVSSNEMFFTLDNTPPVIDILGDDIITIIQNEGPYIDEGATAIDQIQGVVPVTVEGISEVDTNVIGTYSIVYSAEDSCGNSSSLTRTINVVTGCSLSLVVSPSRGTVGDIITLIAVGDTFNPILTDNIVTFGDVIGQVVGGDITRLEVQVPDGATTGDIQVETQISDCSISNPVRFTVIFEDEKFENGNILYTRNKRKETTQGNVNIFGGQVLKPAIYNKDYAYSDYTEVVDENSMVQNVASIILTPQNTRIMNPEFGTKLNTFIFSPVDDIEFFQENVLTEIVRAVGIYEPRVTIDVNNSFVKFDSNTNEVLALITINLPTGLSTELGLTLSTIIKVES